MSWKNKQKDNRSVSKELTFQLCKKYMKCGIKTLKIAEVELITYNDNNNNNGNDNNKR